jgi:predicted site-specific integrase-resolvase
MPIKIGNITLYSALELSQKLNVTTVTIRNYLKQGRIKGEKVMGRWFISDENLIAFFKDSH